MILCRGEQKAILTCLRDIFTQIEKLPPRGANHPYDPACYAEDQIQRYGGFAHDESSIYGDRRGRNTGPTGGGGGGGSGYNNNYDNWEMNNMRGGPMYNNDYNNPPNKGFYPPPPPPPPPPQMMPPVGGQGPMRPMMNPYDQAPDAQTQQVRK